MNYSKKDRNIILIMCCEEAVVEYKWLNSELKEHRDKQCD